MPEPRRVLVVDDEPLARQRLVRLLARAGGFDVREAEDGVAALEAIHAFAPELVLLDVEMPGLSGIELLAQLPERPFRVIFQTAYDEYAVAAFQAEACDYLVKPFTEERLLEALARALRGLASEERLRALERRLAAERGGLSRLAVRIGRRLLLVEARDVAAFVSRDHVTSAVLADGREGTVELSIDALAERLDRGLFRRLHRASLVNAAAVVELRAGATGELTVVMKGGIELPVSRRSRAEAKAIVPR